VYKHWHSMFSVEQEKEQFFIKQMNEFWAGMHKATGMHAMYASVGFGYLRIKFMEMAIKGLGMSVGTGIDASFDTVVKKQPLRRSQKLTGQGASEARYETAELYGRERARTLGGEESSRAWLLSEKSAETAKAFSALAQVPKPMQGAMAAYQGTAAMAVPIRGLRKVEAREGWSYLVAIEDPHRAVIIAHEHKVATPEVAEFLLAFRQHRQSLFPHFQSRLVRSPTKDSYQWLPSPIGTGQGPIRPLEKGPSSQLGRMQSAQRQALAPEPGKRGPTGLGTLQQRLLKYLNGFFDKAQPELKLMAVFHLMDMEHKVGKVLRKMLSPAEIAKVLVKAMAISAGLAALGRLGPIGQALSMGLGKAMKATGGNDIAAIMSVVAFINKALDTRSFQEARVLGHIGVPIIEDIKQLFEAVISAPAAKVGEAAGKKGIDAFQRRLASKPPQTIADAADLARMLGKASPEAQQEVLRQTEQMIAAKRAEGAGSFKPDPEYDQLVAFRNAIKQQSTKDQKLDPFTTPIKRGLPEASKTEAGAGSPEVQLRMKYASELADPLNAAHKKELDRIASIVNPQDKLDATLRLSKNLEVLRSSKISRLPKGVSGGTAIAKAAGFPDAPKGYHWAQYAGGVVIKRNPDGIKANNPPLRFDGPTRTFEPDVALPEGYYWAVKPQGGYSIAKDPGASPNLPALKFVGKTGKIIDGATGKPYVPPLGPGQRPSWRHSELDVGSRLGPAYSEQVSFKGGKPVPHGAPGSTRPDHFSPGPPPHSVEVKNYDVETPEGRAALVDNVTAQAKNRVPELPPGTRQTVYIDVRGQNISIAATQALANKISADSGGIIKLADIEFLR